MNEKDSQMQGEKALEFVKALASKMNVNCEFSKTEDDEKINILINGENAGALIGYRGDVLDAMQYLANSFINGEDIPYKRVNLDCENYREKRAQILANLANRLADKAVRTGRKVRIEPMNPAERRIIHSTLQANENVTTLSEGIDPNRFVIITPKNLREDGFRDRDSFRDNRDNRDRFRNDRRPFNKDRQDQQRDQQRQHQPYQKPSEPPARPAFKTGFGSFLGNNNKK